MNTPEEEGELDPRIGLCSLCEYARKIKHPRGGISYYQCTRSETESQYEKYPAVPVRACEGFVRGFVPPSSA